MARVRLILVLLFSLALSTSAWAQSVSLAPKVARGTISANGGSVTLFLQPGESIGSAMLQTLDSYSGVIEVRCSLDGVVFDADNEPLVNLLGDTSTAANITDTVGTWNINGVAGCRALRVIATSGFAATDTTLIISAIPAGGSSGGSSGGGGETDVSGIEGLLEDLIEAIAPASVFDNAVIPYGVAAHCEAKTLDGSVPNTTTEGFASRAACNTGGYLYSIPTDPTGVSSPVALEDAAEVSGSALMMAGTVRRDVAATSADTTADRATANTDALGLLWTRFLDPCSGVVKTHIPISISTATTTELTAALAGASNNYYVCAIDLITAAANNVALVDDNDDGCGSVTAGMAGGTTAATGWNFAANGGLVKGNGTGTIYKTNGTNRVVCLVTSAATQLSGSISVVAAP